MATPLDKKISVVMGGNPSSVSFRGPHKSITNAIKTTMNLTTQEKPIKVVALVSKRSALVSDWMGALVQVSLDGRQTDQNGP